MTVVRSKSHGVQMHGDHMFWGTKIQGPPDSKVRGGHRPTKVVVDPAPWRSFDASVDMPNTEVSFEIAFLTLKHMLRT